MDYETGGVPQDILDAVHIIRELKDKASISRQEKELLNRARLKVAFWACRSENVVASRENLTYVLGNDAAEIMNAYDKYLDKADNAKEDRDAGKPNRPSGGTQFWENA